MKIAIAMAFFAFVYKYIQARIRLNGGIEIIKNGGYFEVKVGNATITYDMLLEYGETEKHWHVFKQVESKGVLLSSNETIQNEREAKRQIFNHMVWSTYSFYEK